VTICLFISEPASTGLGALFQVTLRNALTGEIVGQMQLILTGDGGREYRDSAGVPYPSEWSYDDVLSHACGRTQEVQA
jgi:hypothetical protein